MNQLTRLTLTEALEGLAKKSFSCLELTQAYLQSMEKQRALNAFILETPEQALSMAKLSDHRRQKGKIGLLEGIPIAIKDLFCTAGIRTTAASKILENFIPPYESTVTSNLWKAGSVLLGKTNLDEFAMGSSNITSYFGPVVSPWKRQNDPTKQLVPGGSSGGSAAAVSARMALAATGTDTGGSIRQPAAFVGIVGLKPTYGLCSRWGIVAFASSLDQAGPMARTVADTAYMLQAMAGHDPKDSTSAVREIPDYVAALKNYTIKGLKIGIPKEYKVAGMSQEIEKLWQQGISWLKAAGAEIHDIQLPHTKYALPTYYIIAPAEASSNLARYDGVRFGLRVPGENLDDMYELTRAAGFGREVKRRILIGTYVLSAGYYDAYYVKAQKLRSLILDDFVQAYKKVDVILTPTAPTPAFAIGDKMDDPIAMYLNDVFTVPVNLAGLPAISVPVGLSADKLPLGLQLIGKPFDEKRLLQVGQVLEKSAALKNDPRLGE
ncbi:MAG TPA: Asp-tRNA(Asn)/Glu-tRNA(Gln) amidotransferase subunit GatA [Alphaproteobacteria bacterium]|nr:Asp-tRNA(Asn)/Glu-tRNA(Gln) amidotransferase subunit GatA [Alphaproteobacteria bacterium]